MYNNLFEYKQVNDDEEKDFINSVFGHDTFPYQGYKNVEIPLIPSQKNDKCYCCKKCQDEKNNKKSVSTQTTESKNK